MLPTKKPNGKWRFCIDFRNLNEALKSIGWPIPNVKVMFDRIGQRRPQWFAVMDLTSGYYQLALDEESRIFTAFRTSDAVYQWKRVPMGLKSAPAHFQKAMVLALQGLIYSIVEAYLDDVILHAKSPEEFCENLRKLLSKFKELGLILNPAKCKFGL